MIVIDASVFVAAIIEDELDIFSQKIYDLIVAEGSNAIIPPIFYYETSNVFIQILRRKRITEEKLSAYLQILSSFPLSVDNEQSILEVANLAKLYNLTVYDASYLETAKRNGFSLATLDKQLSAAALQAKVKLEFSHV